MNRKEIYKKLIKEVGVDLQELLDTVARKINECIESHLSFSVRWELRSHTSNSNRYPQFETVWKHDGTRSSDVFGNRDKLCIQDIFDVILDDVFCSYKSRRYTEDEFKYVALGSIEIHCLQTDTRTTIPFHYEPAHTWTYYKYITCKDESYKEEFEEVFNEH